MSDKMTKAKTEMPDKIRAKLVCDLNTTDVKSFTLKVKEKKNG